MIYDGKERGKTEIIIKEAVKGKKIKGTGSSEDIAKLGGKVLDELVLLWNDQKINASEILPYLSESMKSKAQDIESDYKKIAFNYKRFSKLEPMFSGVSFKERNDKILPFELNLPIIVFGINQNTPYSVKFFYSAEKGVWVADYTTFENMFNIVKNQNFVLVGDKKTFKYNESDKCKNGWFVKVVGDKSIGDLNVKGYSEIGFKTDASISSYSISMGEHKNVVTVEKYNQTFPLKTLEYINKEKPEIITISDISYVSGSTNCNSDITINFSFGDSSIKDSEVK